MADTVTPLHIRQLESSDLADLYEIYSDENTSRYLLSDSWNPDTMQDQFDQKLAVNEKDGSACLAVVKDRKVIGVLSVWKKEMPDTYEIGYVFHKDHRHQGFASVSLMKVIDDLFMNRKAHRVYAELDHQSGADPFYSRNV